MPHWLADERFIDVPLFVSRRRLYKRKTLPIAVTDWALDSGGFSELKEHGHWTITAEQYAAEARRFSQGIGRMQWAAIMDWMCEPQILAMTGLTVGEHQTRTIESLLELSELAPEIPWTPVIQGWHLPDYLAHIRQYAEAGIDLRAFPVVGVGSVCRRQGMVEATQIVTAIRDRGINIHAFGFKIDGVRKANQLIVSSDSMAWSDNARHNAPLPGHTHLTCANCVDWALLWRDKVLGAIETRPIRQHQTVMELEFA